MTVSEYEEQFRVSVPSLHESFVAMQGSGPRRRRRQRFWAAIALAGGIMAANEIALHHPVLNVTHSASQMAHSDARSTPIAGRIGLSPRRMSTLGWASILSSLPEAQLIAPFCTVPE